MVGISPYALGDAKQINGLQKCRPFLFPLVKLLSNRRAPTATAKNPTLGRAFGIHSFAVCISALREPLGADGKRGRMSGKGAAQRDPAQPDRLGGREQ